MKSASRPEIQPAEPAPCRSSGQLSPWQVSSPRSSPCRSQPRTPSASFSLQQYQRCAAAEETIPSISAVMWGLILIPATPVQIQRITPCTSSCRVTCSGSRAASIPAFPKERHQTFFPLQNYACTLLLTFSRCNKKANSPSNNIDYSHYKSLLKTNTWKGHPAVSVCRLSESGWMTAC